MAKNVLILSSSLRKGGNSDLLCDEFVKGVRESGHNAEKIFLKDKSINYCTGCGYCFERTGNCSQKDDMADIRDKMLSADAAWQSAHLPQADESALPGRQTGLRRG